LEELRQFGFREVTINQLEILSVACFSFGFYSSHCVCHRRMRTCQHIAITVLDRYDILFAGNKSEAGVGSERRRRFLDWYGFLFSTTMWNVFVRELYDSVVFSAVHAVMELWNNWVSLG